MTENLALVVGASGIVGRHALELFAGLPGWRALGLSRNPPALAAEGGYVEADLTDPAGCREALKAYPAITHLFYAGRAPDPDPSVEDRVNRAMLTTILDAAEACCPDLRHVQLIHGTKWYGSHLGAYKTPAREDDPRHMPPNFYFSQQDDTAARAAQAGWSWSALRPHMVSGLSVGYPHNIIAVIAAYATISKHLGLPLRFPGRPGCYDSLSQLTDARLLARAMHWAATDPAAADQAFNIVNGEPFRWRDAWPAIADFFDMPVGDVQTVPLATVMADKAPLWSELATRHGLRPLPLAEICDWHYGDFVFAAAWDDLSSTIKARRAGFHEVVDTLPMIIEILTAYRQARIIP